MLSCRWFPSSTAVAHAFAANHSLRLKNALTAARCRLLPDGDPDQSAFVGHEGSQGDGLIKRDMRGIALHHLAIAKIGPPRDEHVLCSIQIGTGQ